MDAFLQGGGKLGSGITHHNAGVLQTEGCDRTVEGVGEKMAQDLHLSGSNYGSSAGVGAAGVGAAGLAGRSRRPGRKAGRSGSMSSVSSSDEESTRAQKREKRQFQSKDGSVHNSKIAAKVADVTPGSKN